MKKPVLLCIFDGYGLAPASTDNAVTEANTPFLDSIFQKYPLCRLRTDGRYVGLPDGQMGNSEVGHMTIGSGRVLKQNLLHISDEVESGEFEKNAVLREMFERVKRRHSTLHIMGLIGLGGVHSHQSHIIATLEAAQKHGVEKIVLHALTDGRDTGIKDSYTFLQELLGVLQKVGGKLGSIGGRYYAMDRDKRWDRIQKAFDAIRGNTFSDYTEDTILEYLESQYSHNITDEFIEPISLRDNPGIQEGDVIFAVNFRTDRLRQMSSVLRDRDFDHFQVSLPDISYYTMTEYSQELEVDGVLYPPINITKTLSEVLATAGKSQLHIAETEKYPHVTFFLNGQREIQYDREKWVVVPSPKVASYDLQPEMSAPQVTERVLETLEEGNTDCIILNFANPDMVGHTGVQQAIIQSLEYLDRAFQKIVEKVLEQDGVVLWTADHGNCEDMENDDGSPMTFHTTNPVMFIPISNHNLSVKSTGSLVDIAPTILTLLDVEKPIEMTGESLIL